MSTTTTATKIQDLPTLTVLAEHAKEIRRLGKRVIADVIEIGRHLSECKDICGHGKWLPWLDREFGWTDKTAENFINGYKLSGKFENFSNLDLPLSGLYLLAAPHAPKEARDEIIERAQAGEPVSVADIKHTIAAAKGRQPRIEHAKVFREMKLGADTVGALEGTALASAREQDELVFLNRGAAEGELTEIVRDLVEGAGRGKRVSAIEYRKSGAAFRRDPIGAASNDESAHIKELEAQLGHFKSQNTVLRSEVRELKAALANTLAAISNEKLLAELERRIPVRLPAVAMLRRALGASEARADLIPNPEAGADSEATKH